MDEIKTIKSRAEYKRKYYAAHPEKQKKWNEEYWMRRVAKMQEAAQNAEAVTEPGATAEQG